MASGLGTCAYNLFIICILLFCRIIIEEDVDRVWSCVMNAVHLMMKEEEEEE